MLLFSSFFFLMFHLFSQTDRLSFRKFLSKMHRLDLFQFFHTVFVMLPLEVI